MAESPESSAQKLETRPVRRQQASQSAETGSGLNGQWIGSFGGSTPGDVVLNIDKTPTGYDGMAILANDDRSLPVTAVSLSIPKQETKFAVATNAILALDPQTLEPVPLDQIKPRFGSFSSVAEVKGEVVNDNLHLSWATDIGVEGDCVIARSDAARPSELVAEKMNWDEFKRFVFGLLEKREMFRGQNDTWRLRTSYHRMGRADIRRFVNQDMPELHRRLSARTKHVFNISIGDENGAFLNLAQHHGYPTPLLDWTYSPYVAAFFAYRGVTNEEAESADANRKVRIHIFNQAAWKSTSESFMQLICAKLHITIAEFIAIENERLIPQQAVTMVTNIDDLETYIRHREAKSGLTFLTAVDLPIAERRCVVRELSYMGITAGSMFPGLDGACEELKERNFDL
jgi:FRG domain